MASNVRRSSPEEDAPQRRDSLDLPGFPWTGSVAPTGAVPTLWREGAGTPLLSENDVLQQLHGAEYSPFFEACGRPLGQTGQTAVAGASAGSFAQTPAVPLPGLASQTSIAQEGLPRAIADSFLAFHLGGGASGHGGQMSASGVCESEYPEAGRGSEQSMPQGFQRGAAGTHGRVYAQRDVTSADLQTGLLASPHSTGVGVSVGAGGGVSSATGVATSHEESDLDRKIVTALQQFLRGRDWVDITTPRQINEVFFPHSNPTATSLERYYIATLVARKHLGNIFRAVVSSTDEFNVRTCAGVCCDCSAIGDLSAEAQQEIEKG